MVAVLRGVLYLVVNLTAYILLKYFVCIPCFLFAYAQEKLVPFPEHPHEKRDNQLFIFK